MVPLVQTALAVNKLAQAMTMPLILPMSMPRLLASASQGQDVDAPRQANQYRRTGNKGRADGDNLRHIDFGSFPLPKTGSQFCLFLGHKLLIANRDDKSRKQ